MVTRLTPKIWLLVVLSFLVPSAPASAARPFWRRCGDIAMSLIGIGEAVPPPAKTAAPMSPRTSDLEALLFRVGYVELGPDFINTRPGLRVEPEVRRRIQAQRDALLALSARENYYGRSVDLEDNHCHGACVYLRRVLKQELGLETTHVTYDPQRFGRSGWQHSFLIVRDYFSPGSPLIIDPTWKQFVRRPLRAGHHDIFVGSPEEYLLRLRAVGFHMWRDTPDEDFMDLMRAVHTDRFD